MKLLRPAIMLTVFFVVGFGLLFPALIYGIAQTIFPHQANGSLIKDSKGQIIGSELLGQNFTAPKYFQPRPSAAGSGYDAANSSGTNLGPNSDKLINGVPDDPKTKDVDESYAGVKQLAEAYRKENNLTAETVLPTDAVTRSASGLDPDISPENARLQAQRVATARGMTADQIEQLVSLHTQGRWLGIYGEARVNVLEINRALDKAKS